MLHNVVPFSSIIAGEEVAGLIKFSSIPRRRKRYTGR